MSGQERQEIAKKYVDKQLKIMKQHGLTTKKISASKYKSLVNKVAESVRA